MTQPNPFAPQQQQQPPPQQPAAGNPFGQQQTPPQAPPQQPPPQQPAASNPFGQQAQQQAPAQDEFDQPEAGGDRVSGEIWKSYAGSLVLFDVKSWRNGVQTENGPSDAAVADVHVIDINGGPIYHENAMIFTPAIRDKLQTSANRGGGKVLGRIKVIQSKQGSRTYPDLDEHTDVDKNTARQYLAWWASRGVQQPAAPAQQQAPPF